jgi:hypothetical protein
MINKSIKHIYYGAGQFIINQNVDTSFKTNLGNIKKVPQFEDHEK